MTSKVAANISSGTNHLTGRDIEAGLLSSASAAYHEWEENAELLSLCSSEHLRLGTVSQAIQ
jgi:hypothetical protein